jgi:HEAT repeat protein
MGSKPSRPQGLGSKVEILLKAKNVDGLRNVAKSGGAEVAAHLYRALQDCDDPQVEVMAIDALGLTSAPEAVKILVDVFTNSTGGPREVAALSLANIVANRVKSAEAIPSLKTIARDADLNEMIRTQAILALCTFRSESPEVSEFLTALKNDPSVSAGLRMMAM